MITRLPDMYIFIIIIIIVIIITLIVIVNKYTVPIVENHFRPKDVCETLISDALSTVSAHFWTIFSVSPNDTARK